MIKQNIVRKNNTKHFIFDFATWQRYLDTLKWKVLTALQNPRNSYTYQTIARHRRYTICCTFFPQTPRREIKESINNIAQSPPISLLLAAISCPTCGDRDLTPLKNNYSPIVDQYTPQRLIFTTKNYRRTILHIFLGLERNRSFSLSSQTKTNNQKPGCVNVCQERCYSLSVLCLSEYVCVSISVC